METTRLATKLTSTLAPALPYLLSAAAGEIDREQIPDSALAADREIWQKIAPATKEHSMLMDAAIELAKHCKDPGAQAAFTHELRRLLDEDSALFENLKKEVIHHFVYHHFDPASSGVSAHH
jgi:hypothetical protein